MSVVAERRLNPKQEAFIAAYLGECNFNATAAARKAGYAEPRQQGHRLLTNVDIQERVTQHLDRLAMPATEVLGRLARHARGTLRIFVEVDGEGRWKLALNEPDSLENFDLIAELGYTEHGPKIKLVDTQAALVQLGRVHKLFTDKNELSGGNGGPIEITSVMVHEPKPDGS